MNSYPPIIMAREGWPFLAGLSAILLLATVLDKAVLKDERNAKVSSTTTILAVLP